jgi:hypothetical protein
MRSDGDLRNDETAKPVGAGWPVIEVDTPHSLDTKKILKALLSV